MKKNISEKLRGIAAQIPGSLPKRTLGKTGLQVTQLALGGQSVIQRKEEYDTAIDLIRSAIEMGINYIDTAPIYEPSEQRIGDAIKGMNRKNLIIASKADDRTRDGALKQLDDSLRYLGTDYLDIWQIHHLDHVDEVKKIFYDDGAMKAFQEAREDGRVRYLGISGHYDPKALLEAMKRFDFDTVLMVTNPADVHKHSMIKQVLPEARKKNMGILGMKVCCRGRLFAPDYVNSMKMAMDYALSLPIDSVVVGHDDLNQLYENVYLAKTWDKLSNKEMEEMEDLTKSYAHLALFFRKGNEEYNPFWDAYEPKG